MSEFHGGFYLRSVDVTLLPLVRRAMRDYLFRTVSNAHEHQIAITTRRGAPVIHLAVDGPETEGHGAAVFHAKHARLGAEIARAAKTEVFAYHYENQAGSEGVTTFDATGAQVGDEQASWDDFAEQKGLSDQLLFAALPLGRLAARLGVARSVIDRLIPEETPSLRVSLVGDVKQATFIEYMKTAPRLPGGEPVEWEKTTLYFPEAWLREIDGLAERLGVSHGFIFHDAWELAKAALYTEPASNEEGQTLAPLPPAPPRPMLLVVPESAPSVPPLAAEGSKVGVPLVLPPDAWVEVRAVAQRLDRSLSWTMQRAYATARARLLGAHASRSGTA